MNLTAGQAKRLIEWVGAALEAEGLCVMGFYHAPLGMSAGAKGAVRLFWCRKARGLGVRPCSGHGEDSARELGWLVESVLFSQGFAVGDGGLYRPGYVPDSMERALRRATGGTWAWDSRGWGYCRGALRLADHAAGDYQLQMRMGGHALTPWFRQGVGEALADYHQRVAREVQRVVVTMRGGA